MTSIRGLLINMHSGKCHTPTNIISHFVRLFVTTLDRKIEIDYEIDEIRNVE